jgi:hypothetical protein
VTNTKDVANIQVYLHAKFYIFLRSLNVSSVLFSLLLKKLNGKGILKWKNLRASYPSKPARFYSTSGPAHLYKPVALFSSSGHCQAGPSVLRTPHVSLSPSRAETVMHPIATTPGTLPNPSPSSAPASCRSSVQFRSTDRPRAVPQCCPAESPLLHRLAPSRTDASPRATARLCSCRT